MLLEKKTSKRSFFDAPEDVGADFPDWYKESRGIAWKTFQDLPWPQRNDEAWRFANIKKLSYENLSDASEVDQFDFEDLIDRSISLTEQAGRILFVNDRLIADPFLETEFAEKGVIFKSLSKALVEDSELVRSYFMREAAQLGSSKFAALHRARLRDGFFFYIPKNVSLSRSVEVFHWLSGENASVFPHSLIVAGPGSTATVAEYVASVDDRFGFCCGVSDLVAEENSKLTYVRTQNLSEKAQSIQLSSARAEAGSDVKSFTLNLGCEWVRGESVSRLVGEGANSEMLAVSVPEGTQEIDLRTLQLHEKPQTMSNLLYKNALYDESRSIFAGMIMVEEGAHHTDAYQTCRNLLMSETCEANSMPGLEIKADQVKCSHGSTSTPVTKEELFYLRTRGIKEPFARQLMTFGFVKEAVDLIGNAALEEVVLGKLNRRFSRIGVK